VNQKEVESVMPVVPFQTSHGCLDGGVPLPGASCRLNLETPSHICSVMRFRMKETADGRFLDEHSMRSLQSHKRGYILCSVLRTVILRTCTVACA
jgi:hypothetical protein